MAEVCCKKMSKLWAEEKEKKFQHTSIRDKNRLRYCLKRSWTAGVRDGFFPIKGSCRPEQDKGSF